MGGKLDKAGNALLKDGSLQAMQDPAAAKGTPGGPTGNGALDAATLNMPVKTSQGIKTPAQMGIKTYSELQQKGGQAFSGGYNDPTTTALTAEIMQKTGASYLSAQNDSYHQTNAPGSGHTKGVKTDFSYAGLSDGGYKGKHAEISQHLASKYGMQEGQDFKIISDPHGTGKHIDFKLNESGRAKAEAVRQAQAQGQAQAQVAANATPASGQSQAATPAVENSKPDTAPAAQTAQAPKSFYDPNSKLSTHQQASLGSIQKRIDEANASGNTAAAQKWEAMKSAKEKDYGVTPQQQGQTPAQSAQQPSQQAAATDSPAQAQPAQATSKSASMQIVDKRIADARAAGNEAQARKWESFRDMKAGRPAQSQPKQPESAQDIKASTPPPPAPDNSGVEKAVNNLAQAQQQRNTEQERKTDEQSTPNIPTQFDDYTLQTWAHDRA